MSCVGRYRLWVVCRELRVMGDGSCSVALVRMISSWLSVSGAKFVVLWKLWVYVGKYILIV